MPDFFDEFERFVEQHMMGEHRKRMKEVEKAEKQMEEQEKKLQQNVKRLNNKDAEDPFGQ
ncbi:hypothetical protein [Priestia megaterium]|uniref:hypothetical protein n=1 Tax=Priestia megaterium TaxID=1404 RepID=UPI00186601EA|nr:hypothetical protein [Priestia megaterium]MBE2975536.1 hypothetical protein [Priestia megaterium]